MRGEGCRGALQTALSAPPAGPGGQLATAAVQRRARGFMSQSQPPAERLEGKAVDEVSPLAARALLYREYVSNCANPSDCKCPAMSLGNFAYFKVMETCGRRRLPLLELLVPRSPCEVPLPWTCATGTGALNISLPAEGASAVLVLRLKRCQGRGGRLGDTVRSPWRHGIHTQVAAGGTRSTSWFLVVPQPLPLHWSSRGAHVEESEVFLYQRQRNRNFPEVFLFFAGVYL